MILHTVLHGTHFLGALLQMTADHPSPITLKNYLQEYTKRDNLKCSYTVHMQEYFIQILGALKFYKNFIYCQFNVLISTGQVYKI